MQDSDDQAKGKGIVEHFAHYQYQRKGKKIIYISWCNFDDKDAENGTFLTKRQIS